MKTVDAKIKVTPDFKAYLELEDKLRNHEEDDEEYDRLLDEMDDAWFRLSEMEIVLIQAIASYYNKLDKIEQIEEGHYDETM